MRVHAIRALGGYKQVENGVEFTHWILDKNTYSEFWNAKRYVNEEVPRLKKDISDKDAKIADLEKQLEESCKIANDNYDYVQKNKEELESVLAEAKKNKKTIDKVLEVCRERANKDRGIKDKKGNSGYVVLVSERTFYKTSKSQGVWLWKTVIQLPFFTELDFKQMLELWRDDNCRYQYFRDIGIGDYVETDLGYYELSELSGNCWVRNEFRKNFKSGFWEVTLLHNSEVIL